MSRRILLLTQWFDPEPTFKGLLFARELVKRGFHVEVVTGFPNYPGGKVYQGYKIRLMQREIIDGVDITRLPLYPSHDGSALKRMANYVSFAVTSLFYCLFLSKKADVIYAYHPPLTIGIVAIITRFFRKTPIVYDIQDMWPDTLRATGMISSEKVLSCIGRVAEWVYRRVDRIAVLSPGFKRLLIERGVDERKVDVIPNWCDEHALMNPLRNSEAPSVFAKKCLKVVFAGNMGKAQSLDTIVKAAKLLEDAGVPAAFILIGDGVELSTLVASVKKYNLTSVFFLSQLPMKEIGSYLERADVLLVHLKKDPLFSITIPSKTQAYMAVGKPILMGVEGDAADIIRAAKCGLVFEPENSQALANAVEELTTLADKDLAVLAARARDYYLLNLSLASGVDQFAHIFAELTDSVRCND